MIYTPEVEDSFRNFSEAFVQSMDREAWRDPSKREFSKGAVIAMYDVARTLLEDETVALEDLIQTKLVEVIDERIRLNNQGKKLDKAEGCCFFLVCCLEHVTKKQQLAEATAPA